MDPNSDPLPDLLPDPLSLKLVREILEPDEEIRVHAEAVDAVVAVTDRRLIVASEQRLAPAVPLDAVRRIQFDIERERPALLVIVPDSPAAQPQVLAFRPNHFSGTGRALAVIGERLARP